jgi:hypothetical protein
VRYFAHISMREPVKRGQVPGSIGVDDSPTNSMPIGQAHCFRWAEGGLAVWCLIVGGTDLPGEWVIVDREFIPARDDGRQPPGR